MTDLSRFETLEINSHQIRVRILDAKPNPVKPISLVWLPGFMSTCTSIKVDAVFELAQSLNIGAISLDYSGHGASSGDLRKATMSQWMLEIQTALDTFAPQTKKLVIGSSMGGWLATHLALQDHDDQLAGLVLIAPAINMTQRLISQKLDDGQKEELIKNGYLVRPTPYGEDPYIIAKSLIEDGVDWLIQDANLNISLPIHILHGAQDQDVPLEVSKDLISRLPHSNTNLIIIPDGGHRLSRDKDIALLKAAIMSQIDAL